MTHNDDSEDCGEIGPLHDFRCVPEPMLIMPLPYQQDEREISKQGCLDGLDEAASSMFDLLRRWFEVGDTYALNLSSIAPEEDWRDSSGVAALTMRRLQALHHVATSQTPTTSLMVVSLIYGSIQLLIEAHSRHVLHIGATWDAEGDLLALLCGDLDQVVPLQTTDPDPELEEFYSAFKQLVTVMHRTATLSAGSQLILR